MIGLTLGQCKMSASLVCKGSEGSLLPAQVKALIDCGRLQPLNLPTEALEGPMSLRQAANGGGLLSAELALMWRVLCTWLQVKLPLHTSVIILWEMCQKGHTRSA